MSVESKDNPSKKALLLGISRLTLLDQVISKDNQTFLIGELCRQAVVIVKDIEAAVTAFLYQEGKETPEFQLFFRAIMNLLLQQKYLSICVGKLDQYILTEAYEKIFQPYFQIGLQPINIWERYNICFDKKKGSHSKSYSYACVEEEIQALSATCTNLSSKSIILRELEILWKTKNLSADRLQYLRKLWSTRQIPRRHFLDFVRITILHSFLANMGEVACRKAFPFSGSDWSAKSYERIVSSFISRFKRN